MPSGSLIPSPVFTGWDANGNPLANGKLFTYIAGTLTQTPVYTDVDLTIPHPNPVILDAAGRAIIFLASGSFKFVLKSSADVTQWTSDNIQAPHTNQTRLGDIYQFGGDSTSPITATSYPSGTTIDKTHAGTSVHNLDSDSIPDGTYVLEGMLLALSGITVTAGIVNLSDGNPDVALVEITSTSATGERKRSSAITLPAGGAAKDLAIKTEVSAGSGFAWGLRLLRSA